MKLHDASREIEPEANPGDTPTGAIAPPPKLLEDATHVIRVDAVPLVAHREAQVVVHPLHSQLDWRARTRVLGRVAEQIAQHLPDALVVSEYRFLRSRGGHERAATCE